MNKKFSQVAINLEQEDVKALSDMMRKDGFTDNMRSAFLRRLIRQEWQRQQESNQKAEVKS
jgi:metal-responsive CopG/Arc/MetJ family transcriptional regulator